MQNIASSLTNEMADILCFDNKQKGRLECLHCTFNWSKPSPLY